MYFSNILGPNTMVCWEMFSSCVPRPPHPKEHQPHFAAFSGFYGINTSNFKVQCNTAEKS